MVFTLVFRCKYYFHIFWIKFIDRSKQCRYGFQPGSAKKKNFTVGIFEPSPPLFLIKILRGRTFRNRVTLGGGGIATILLERGDNPEKRVLM